MKYVWYVQDYNNPVSIDEVYTTKKAAFATAKKIYPKGIFKKLNNCLYCYQPRGKNPDIYCDIRKVPVIHAESS